MSLYLPEEEGLPTRLGALVVKPVPADPEWKRIGVDLYAHRDTGMLKFTPPTPEAPLKPEPKPVVDNVWHDDEPPHIGWWNCSIVRKSDAFRYWNGDFWSLVARPGDPATLRAVRKSGQSSHPAKEWRHSPVPPWGRE